MTRSLEAKGTRAVVLDGEGGFLDRIRAQIDSRPEAEEIEAEAEDGDEAEIEDGDEQN